MALNFYYLSDNPPVTNEFSYHGLQPVNPGSILSIDRNFCLTPASATLQILDRVGLPQEHQGLITSSRGVFMLVASLITVIPVTAGCVYTNAQGSLWLVKSVVPTVFGVNADILQTDRSYLLSEQELEIASQLGLFSYAQILIEVLKCWGVLHCTHPEKIFLRKVLLNRQEVTLYGSPPILGIEMTMHVSSGQMHPQYWWNPSFGTGIDVKLIVSSNTPGPNQGYSYNLRQNLNVLDFEAPLAAGILFRNRGEDNVLDALGNERPRLIDELHILIEKAVWERVMDPKHELPHPSVDLKRRIERIINRDDLEKIISQSKKKLGMQQ